LKPDLDWFAGGRGRQRPSYQVGKVSLKVSWPAASFFGLMSGDDAHGILDTLQRLESKQDTMRADIMARIDRLQPKVDQTHDALVVDLGNTDRIERIARAAVDDGRTTTEILRVMQRQIMRLETDVEQLKGAP
jgi:hypothetical protein